MRVAIVLTLISVDLFVQASPLTRRTAEATCWFGNIHGACNGSSTGCTDFGWLVCSYTSSLLLGGLLLTPS